MIQRVFSARGSLAVALVSLSTAGLATAQVANLRITEVDPANDLVEVTNLGPAFTSVAAYPFCHRFNYASSIPVGTSFAQGESRTFTVSGLDDNDSDLWLYRATPFGDAANIVHGVKYGGQANIGRTALAATVGLWPSGSAFVPAPGAGETVAFDGLGNTPFDWFVDATPSIGVFPDTVAFDSTPDLLDVPAGTEDFERLTLGTALRELQGWPLVDSNPTVGDFDAHVIAGFGGKVLRVRDQDDSNAQNRFYSRFLSTGGVTTKYSLSFDLNPLELPTSAASLPRVTVQHILTTGGLSNVFGLEYDATNGVRLIVFANGGVPASIPVGALPLGSWSLLRLTVDPVGGTVEASIAGGTPVSAPIALASNVDATQLRFCYRGEGQGNVSTQLFDNIRFEFGEAANENVVLGTPPQPNWLRAGLTSGPVLGATWDPFVDPFVGGAIADVLFVAEGAVVPNFPTVFGDALFGGNVLFIADVPAGSPFAVAIPNDLRLSGAVVTAQALEIGTGGLRLTNALEATLGF